MFLSGMLCCIRICIAASLIVSGTVPRVSGTVPRVGGTVPRVGGTIPRVIGTAACVNGTVPCVSGTVPHPCIICLLCIQTRPPAL